MSELKLNIVNENTGESVLRAVVLAVLSEMGVEGVSQEEIGNAVSSYFGNNPIETLSENDVTAIVTNYVNEHTTPPHTDAQIKQIVADYINNETDTDIDFEELLSNGGTE